MTDSPATPVPAEQIIKPVPPADDASLDTWREYHRQMVSWIDWQHDIESWRGSVESRLEGLEEVTNLIPEILERLGRQTLTPDNQRCCYWTWWRIRFPSVMDDIVQKEPF